MLGGRTMLRSVSIEPGFYGRGCFDVTVDRDGEVAITLQQDGTSDWLIGRALPGVAREAAIGLTGFVTKPADIIANLLGMAPVVATPAPSDTHGCGGLFED